MKTDKDTHIPFRKKKAILTCCLFFYKGHWESLLEPLPDLFSYNQSVFLYVDERHIYSRALRKYGFEHVRLVKVLFSLRICPFA